VVSRAQGSIVEPVTLMPSGMFAGYCMRRGAPSPLGFVDESAVTKEEIAADRAPGK
jgi:hypothetical protein